MNREIKLLLLDRWRRSLLSERVVAGGVCFFSAAMTVFNRTDMSALIAVYGGAALWTVAFGIQPAALKVYRQLPLRRDDVDATGISIVLGAAGIVFLIMVPSTYCFDLLIDKREWFSPANCLATCSAAAALALIWALVQFALGGAESGGQILKSYAAMNAATRIVIKSGFLMLPLVAGYAALRILGMNGPLQAFIYLTGAIGLAAGCRRWLPALAERVQIANIQEGLQVPGRNIRRFPPTDESPRMTIAEHILRPALTLLAIFAAVLSLLWLLNSFHPTSQTPLPELTAVLMLILPLQDKFAGAKAYRSLPIHPKRLTGAVCIFPAIASILAAMEFMLNVRGLADGAGLAGVLLGSFGCLSATAAFGLGWGGHVGYLCFIVLGFGLPMLFAFSHGNDPAMRSALFALYLCLAGATAAFGPWLLHRVLTRRSEPYRVRAGGSR